MMTAREMFEELGYEETLNNKYTLSYTAKFFVSDKHRIEFYKNAKEFICHYYSDSPFEPAKPFNVSLKELQAINQQVKELGWDD
jgi:hypothetical protein